MSILEQTPVPLLQRADEFEALLEMYRERAPKRVLEIGTYHGGTLYHWLQNAQPGTRVVSVDSYATDVDNRPLYEGWMPEGVSLDVIEGDTGDLRVFLQVAKCSPEYDWVFIDAGHRYDEVKHDWLSFGQLSTGVVAFHDILYPDVARLWDEIKQSAPKKAKFLEFISDPVTEWDGWCGIGVVLM